MGSYHQYCIHWAKLFYTCSLHCLEHSGRCIDLNGPTNASNSPRNNKKKVDSHSAALRLASLASLDSLMTLLHKKLCSSTHTWGEKKTHCALVVKANMVRAMGSPIKQIFSVEDEGGSAWFTVHHCFAMILADVAGSTGTSLSVLLFGFRQKACS